MGMTPELAIALLACARIGAVHSVIFGGFAANALVDRINDASCVAVLTQDGSYRRGQEVRLKAIVDEALVNCPTVKNVVVYRRTGSVVPMKEGRDQWWQELVDKAPADCPAEPLDAEGAGAHDRWLFGANLPYQQADLRSQAGRRLLVYGRCWLGYRALLRGLWHPAKRGYHSHV
jgi:hypothetical protein